MAEKSTDRDLVARVRTPIAFDEAVEDAGVITPPVAGLIIRNPRGFICDPSAL